MGSMTKDSNGVPLQWVDASPASPPTSQGTIPHQGLEVTGRSSYSNVPVGSVAYGSFGTSGTHTAGTWYISELVIERNFLVTNVNILNGATAATDKYIAAIYDAAGNLIANSATAGILASGTNAFQTLALTTPVKVQGPARYWVAVQANGTTTTTRKVAASTYIDCLCNTLAGSFGTVPATITPPTSFNATTAVVSYVN